jgi:hypothetical protein
VIKSRIQAYLTIRTDGFCSQIDRRAYPLLPIDTHGSAIPWHPCGTAFAAAVTESRRHRREEETADGIRLVRELGFL